MSVLVQRPHQLPGLISLPRQHIPSPRRPQPPRAAQSATVQAAVLSPRVSRRQRGTQSSAPKDSPAANTRSAKRRSNTNLPVADPADSKPSPAASVTISSTNAPAFPSGNLPISSSALATVSASQVSVLSASIQPTTTPSLPATTTPPRKANINSRSAPNTPTPNHSLPVPANRRRARSPRPTAKLPGLNLEEDSNDEATTGHLNTPAAKRGRRINAPGSIPLPTTSTPPSVPTTWQQAALLKVGNTPGPLVTSSLPPLVDHTTAVKGGSASTPVSPARTQPPTDTAFGSVHLAHSPTVPNFPTATRRPAHTRAPSVPSFPLDALFSSAMVLDTPSTPKNGHNRTQSVSSSLPPASSLHARMMGAGHGSGRRERTLTGNGSPGSKFASANFQRAPDAMMLPKPMFVGGGRFGMLGGGSSSDDSSSSSGEEQVVDLSADSADEDEVAFFN